MFNSKNTANDVKAKQRVLSEKWSKRIGAVQEVQGSEMPFEKKGALAQILENTSAAYNMNRSINESTDAGSTDGIKRFALDLVTTVNY